MVVEAAGTKISSENLLFFNRQLASMVRLGLPVSRGLRALAREVQDPDFRDLLEAVQHDLDQGISLEQALRKHPRIFSELYLQMLEAGEKTGSLAMVLDELANYSETMMNVKRQVMKAAAYPVLVGVASVILLFLILVFSVPQFQDLFGRMDPSELPAMTRFVFSLSDVVRTPWVSAPLLLLVVGVTVYASVVVREASSRLDQFVMGIPVFGVLFEKMALMKTCRTLGDLLKNGVPIATALALTARTLGNNRIREALLSMTRAVENGRRMSEESKKLGVFPETMSWKLTMAEERGILEDTLVEMADYYELDLSLYCDRVTTILGPIGILFIALVVGLVVAALYLPLFGMHSAILGG